mmetsp:Transcript_100775/g.291388  ORF Transcript_100775/g.291388 Transcript_100775/m.291388 type:complete len:245 (-) Transcript_100775:225-959(-)
MTRSPRTCCRSLQTPSRWLTTTAAVRSRSPSSLVSCRRSPAGHPRPRSRPRPRRSPGLRRRLPMRRLPHRCRRRPHPRPRSRRQLPAETLRCRAPRCGRRGPPTPQGVGCRRPNSRRRRSRRRTPGRQGRRRLRPTHFGRTSTSTSTSRTTSIRRTAITSPWCPRHRQTTARSSQDRRTRRGRRCRRSSRLAPMRRSRRTWGQPCCRCAASSRPMRTASERCASPPGLWCCAQCCSASAPSLPR